MRHTDSNHCQHECSQSTSTHFAPEVLLQGQFTLVSRSVHTCFKVSLHFPKPGLYPCSEQALQFFPLQRSFFYLPVLNLDLWHIQTNTRACKNEFQHFNTQNAAYSTLRVESYCSPMKIPPSNHYFKIKISTVFVDNFTPSEGVKYVSYCSQGAKHHSRALRALE